jgi:serine/threonine-protein kinase RsbW
MLESIGVRTEFITASLMQSSDSPEQPLPEKDFDPDQLTLILRVTLAADRNAVDPVVQEVMAVVRQMKDVDGKEDAIELSLQEALANAVIHGAKEDPTQTVECLVSSDGEGSILIVVRDPGTGFSPEAIPGCTVGENVYSNHGRGIFLINQLMDKVEFRKNGTEIRMVKR